MIDLESVEAVNKSTYRKVFRKPLYDSYYFSRIPSEIESMLEGEYETVILLFVDGFGWTFSEKYADQFDLFKESHVTKLTSQFPSTTAAHVTTIHTGLEVGQTGIYEWFHYEPL